MLKYPKILNISLHFVLRNSKKNKKLHKNTEYKIQNNKKSPEMIMQIIENIKEIKFRFWIKSEENKKIKVNQTETNQNICAHQNETKRKNNRNLQFFMLKAKNHGEYCN